MMCEWCGHDHPREALCPSKPKWSRRGFLALAGAGIAGYALSGMLPTTIRATSNAWMTLNGRVSGSSVIVPLKSWSVSLASGWNDLKGSTDAGVLDVSTDGLVTVEGAVLEVPTFGRLYQLRGRLLDPIRLAPKKGNMITVTWPVNVSGL